MKRSESEPALSKPAYGGFPLWRNFYLRTHVNFSRVNKIEAMYERPIAKAKVERASIFSFSGVKFTCLRT